MARIRTLKPELLTDEKTSGLTPLQWRTFVSLILMADDYGNTRASASFVHSQALWATEIEVEQVKSCLLFLEEIGLIETYAVRGQSYLHIAGWSKHQRIDKPGKPQVPSTSDPEKSPSKGWLTYFIRLGDDGPIKIGKTIDVAARLAKLQTSSPRKLNVLRVIASNVEAELHRKFAKFRTFGEWFEPAKPLLDFIGSESFANGSRIEPEQVAPDLEGDREKERNSPSAPACDPCTTEQVKPKHMQARAWLTSFGSAWCRKFEKVAYGAGEADARACGRFDSTLEALDQGDVLEAWNRKADIFAEFLETDDRAARNAGYQFAFFASNFLAYMLPKDKRASPEPRKRGGVIPETW